MISYKDLREARAKRVAKEKATIEKGRGKRGRKRKSPCTRGGFVSANGQRSAGASESPSAMEGPSGANVLEKCC